MQQMTLSLAPAPSPMLQNFVAGHNAELLSVLTALAHGERAERFVYLWGVSGCGKTHLLKAMYSEFENRNVTVSMLTGGMLTGGMLAEATTLATVSDYDAVLADDVDRLTEQGQQRLFNVYNAQRDKGAILIAAGAVPPARLALRKDLVTRLGWGLVYQVQTLSDQEKMAAMTEHARARGFRLSREVMDYVFKRQSRDLRALLALLDALDRYSLENKRAVTIPLVRELLSQQATPR